MTTSSRTDLLNLVYRFYPRGIMQISRIHLAPGEMCYDDTEEYHRLVEAANRGRAEYPTWQALISRLRERYGLQDESICLQAGWVVPAYAARIWLAHDKSIKLTVSLLGPYYGIHLPGIVGEGPVACEVAQEIESTYPDHQTIPPELGNEIVPDVDAWQPYGEATIYSCILSDVWTWA